MKLFNTLSRTIEEFTPLDSSNVRMYTCGPTVYREIHIGNLRTYLTSDVLRRVLQFNGYTTKTVMNITDVGHFRYSQEAGKVIDPVMEEARAFNTTPLEISKKYTKLFLEDEEKLGIVKPDVLSKATEHIDQMQKLIATLLEKEYAYIADGNVYFDVKKFKDYGKLSGNTLDKMDQLLEAVRVSVETDKKDSADFALWKKAAPDQVMKWDSPWGEGVPGWHIECSAMSLEYLGNHFDIHAGGEDLIFPHHEDEIAQSESATGEPFANYWVHSNYLLVDGEKMSRSKRNVYTVADIQKKKFSPLTFRYLTFQTHYRSRMNFTWEALSGAQTTLDKLYELVSELPKGTVGNIEYVRDFQEAVNLDLNMPKAVSIMWEMLRSKIPEEEKYASLLEMDEVLGLNMAVESQELTQIPQEVINLAQERESMRKNKKFNDADRLRVEIERKGYFLKDTKEGTKIVKRG
jgi:cysteinyl-tRNA synthetase